MIEYVNIPCYPRAGHSVFAIKDKFYVYGGWNLESHFNDIALFNITTWEWIIPDIFNETPRWHFTAVMVEAIPSWRYFIFRGEIGDFPDERPRRIENTVIVLNLNGLFMQIFDMKTHFLFPFGYFLCSIELGKWPISKRKQNEVPGTGKSRLILIEIKNSSCALDIDKMSWMTIRTENDDKEEGPFQTHSREYSSMIYNFKNYWLIAFGGWANKWLEDSYG